MENLYIKEKKLETVLNKLKTLVETPNDISYGLAELNKEKNQLESEKNEIENKYNQLIV